MRSLLAVGAIERPAGREAAPTTSTPRYRIALYAAQTIYVPDKDYVPSEPSTPPANVQCSPSQSQNDEGAADAEDKSDSSGMLNFTYPVRSFFYRYAILRVNCVKIICGAGTNLKVGGTCQL